MPRTRKGTKVIGRRPQRRRLQVAILEWVGTAYARSSKYTVWGLTFEEVEPAVRRFLERLVAEKVKP